MKKNKQYECVQLLDSILDKRDQIIADIKNGSDSPEVKKKKIKIAEKKHTRVLQYIADTCKSIYEAEIERESSILQQASNMQSAFSFITAGLFVVAQIVTDNIDRDSSLSSSDIFHGFSHITLWLILSLVLATLAQRRFIRQHGTPTTRQFIQTSNKDYDLMQSNNERLILEIREYDRFYFSLNKINKKRVLCVQFSMFAFYAALAQSVIYGFLMAKIAGL